MKFTDEKTQFLYENAISKFSYYSKCAKDDVRPRIMNQAIKYYDDAEAAFISHVEARLRREQQPCEWELNQNKIIEDKIERVMSWWHFCPACGRKLEE